VNKFQRWMMAIAGVLILVVGGAVVRNQVKVRNGRVARAEVKQRQHPVRPEGADVVSRRKALFDLLRPVALRNCELQRFGEANDGGYLMCRNLLQDVEVAYSYGIGGYDKWGCDISKALDVTVHQYDCFNPKQPACYFGDTVFHTECVAGTAATMDGRVFDTVQNQMVRNGDGARRLVWKIDVEGAEWKSLLTIPTDILERTDQMAVEFHWAEDADHRWQDDPDYLAVIRRLTQFFEVAHIHFNNASCVADLSPFPSSAYEVLFVSKRVAVVDPDRGAGGIHPLDAPNNSSLPECQVVGR